MGQRDGTAPQATSGPQLQVGDFDRVDASFRPAAFARWMEQQRSSGADPAIEALGLTGEQRTLDLGCGTGVDLRALETRSRLAVGMDRSRAMLHGAAGSRLVAADAAAVPLRGASLDAVWCRLVLIHCADPRAVVQEIARTLRPGGRAVLTEPDHRSHTVACDQPDVFERVKASRFTRFRNPFIGSELPELVAHAGLALDATWVNPIIFRSFAEARAAGGPFDRAVDDAVGDGAITSAEGAAYLASLEAHDQRGTFLFTGTSVTVVARSTEA